MAFNVFIFNNVIKNNIKYHYVSLSVIKCFNVIKYFDVFRCKALKILRFNKAILSQWETLSSVNFQGTAHCNGKKIV